MVDHNAMGAVPPGDRDPLHVSSLSAGFAKARALAEIKGSGERIGQRQTRHHPFNAKCA